MYNSFDELTKGLAQSVTRRAALKKFGIGLAGMALASFGLASKAEAGQRPSWCAPTDICCCRKCKTHLPTTDSHFAVCQAQCGFTCHQI